MAIFLEPWLSPGTLNSREILVSALCLSELLQAFDSSVTCRSIAAECQGQLPVTWVGRKTETLIAPELLEAMSQNTGQLGPSPLRTAIVAVRSVERAVLLSRKTCPGLLKAFMPGVNQEKRTRCCPTGNQPHCASLTIGSNW